MVDRERLADDPEFQIHGTSILGRAIASLRNSFGMKPDATKATDGGLDALRLLQRDVSAKRTERTYVVDLLVAATAQAWGLTVLHVDTDFDTIAQVVAIGTRRADEA